MQGARDSTRLTGGTKILGVLWCRKIRDAVQCEGVLPFYYLVIFLAHPEVFYPFYLLSVYSYTYFLLSLALRQQLALHSPSFTLSFKVNRTGKTNRRVSQLDYLSFYLRLLHTTDTGDSFLP